MVHCAPLHVSPWLPRQQKNPGHVHVSGTGMHLEGKESQFHSLDQEHLLEQ